MSIKYTFERLVALGKFDKTEGLEMFVGGAEPAARTAPGGTMAVMLWLPQSKEVVLLSQAYACDSGLVRAKRAPVEEILENDDMGRFKGDILNEQLDGELVRELVRVADELAAKAEAQDLNVQPMRRLEPVGILDVFQEGFSFTQRATAVGLLLGSITAVSSALAYGLITAASIVTANAWVVLGLTVVGMAVLRLTGVTGRLGGACLWFSNKVMGLIWPAETEEDRSEGVFAKVKSGLSSGWKKFKNFFSFGKTAAA